MTKKGHKDLCMDVYFRDDYIEINPYTGEEMGVYNPYTGEIIPLRKDVYKRQPPGSSRAQIRRWPYPGQRCSVFAFRGRRLSNHPWLFL